MRNKRLMGIVGVGGAVVFAVSLLPRPALEQPAIAPRVSTPTEPADSKALLTRPVHQTHTKVIHYTVMKPVYENCEKQINYTVMKPVYETLHKKISYIQTIPVQEQITTSVPGRAEPVTYTVTRQVSEHREKDVSYTVCRMVPESRTKTCRYTTCKMVPEARQKTVRYQTTRFETTSVNDAHGSSDVEHAAGEL